MLVTYGFHSLPCSSKQKKYSVSDHARGIRLGHSPMQASVGSRTWGQSCHSREEVVVWQGFNKCKCMKLGPDRKFVGVLSRGSTVYGIMKHLRAKGCGRFWIGHIYILNLLDWNSVCSSYVLLLWSRVIVCLFGLKRGKYGACFRLRKFTYFCLMHPYSLFGNTVHTNGVGVLCSENQSNRSHSRSCNLSRNEFPHANSL